MAGYEDMLAAKQRERENMAQETPSAPQAQGQTDAGSMTLEEALRLGLVTLTPGAGQADEAQAEPTQPEQQVVEQTQSVQPEQPAAEPAQTVQAEPELKEQAEQPMEGPAEVVRRKRKRTRHHARHTDEERRGNDPTSGIEDLSDEKDVPDNAMTEAVTEASMPEPVPQTDELMRAAQEEDETLRSILNESMGDSRDGLKEGPDPGEGTQAIPEEDRPIMDEFSLDGPITEEPDDAGDGTEEPADFEPGMDELDMENTREPDMGDLIMDGPEDDGTPVEEPVMDETWQGQSAESEEKLLSGDMASAVEGYAEEGYPWEDDPGSGQEEPDIEDAEHNEEPETYTEPDEAAPEFFDEPDEPNVRMEADHLIISVISGRGAYEVSDEVRDTAVRALQDAIADLGGTTSERVMTEAYDAIMEIQQAVIDANNKYIDTQRELMRVTDDVMRRQDEAKKAMESYDYLVGKTFRNTDQG